MKKLNWTILLFLLITKISYSQSKIDYEAAMQSTITNKSSVPFWLRSNQNGSIPVKGASGSMIMKVHRDYDSTSNRLLDWGFGFEGRANLGNKSELLLIQSYLKLKAGIFQLKAGRSKDIMGLNGDTSLSSGNFAVSGNALGVPQIEISIPQYWTIPIADGLIAIKGTFSHGYLGRKDVLDTIRTAPPTSFRYPLYDTHPKTYFHQKSFYGRIGKPEWKLKLYGGFSHQVFWGNERKIYGEDFDLSPIETFFYVAVGKTYGAGKIPRSKIGNQLGSIDIGAEYDFSNITMLIYRQSFYDVGALSKLANIKDGLNGITLRNKNFNRSNDGFKWKTILLELFYSKNQAGEFGSKPTKSGDEDYYNNYFYLNGWTYKNMVLGSPFITSKILGRSDLPSFQNEYFVNNRVVAFHLGLEAAVKTFRIMTKASYSANYGTFGTSPEGHTTGDEPRSVTPVELLFGRVNQFSGLVQVNKELKNNFDLGVTIAADEGKLLNNSFGMSVKLSKKF
ncbi:capsule assembly Wzi family protein [Pararcticibacter amylolyticus]|uniref:Capsule assembly Wzi family protein n=1 Tax=Pararcticibacter amylolyticus TaxID=2173175 RepID=A0A2U2PBN8_9SPHI|nr:capsule assembly Wzi family protein [Pararcticibacter amylolyticus]PWG78714.1 hypothetical protein DDR33_21070 [Pararcticibacter amylolyticus]